MNVTDRVPAARPDPVAIDISGGIAAARVLAIFFMMYVHVWPGIGFIRMNLADMSGFQRIATFVIDVLGRSSVPLLTIISAFLLRKALGRRSWAEATVGKARTLIVPMTCWCAIFLMLASVVELAGSQRSALPEPALLPLLNSLFALTEMPAIAPLGFLRDLFVCTLLAPLLVRGMDRAPIPLLLGVLAFACWNPENWLILRPQILLFFLIGLGVAGGWRLPGLRDRWMAAAVAAALLFVGARFLVANLELVEAISNPGWFQRLMSNVARLAVSYLFWLAALRAMQGWARPALLKLEPYIFLTFCSHVILFRMLGMTGLDPAAFYYPLLFALQPVMAVVAAIIFARTMAHVWPSLLKLLNAGRLPRPRAI